jgi:hypothetical protein
MFTVQCPDLHERVLVTDRLVEARTPTPHGTVISFHCPCGGEGVRLNDPDSDAGHVVAHHGPEELLGLAA